MRKYHVSCRQFKGRAPQRAAYEHKNNIECLTSKAQRAERFIRLIHQWRWPENRFTALGEKVVGSILYAITAPILVYRHRQAQFRLRVYFRVHTGLFLLPLVALGPSARPASVRAERTRKMRSYFKFRNYQERMSQRMIV